MYYLSVEYYASSFILNMAVNIISLIALASHLL